jgi:hypothetical protein
MSEIKDDAGFLVLLPRCSIQANWFGATLIVAQESKADITVGEKPYLVDDNCLNSFDKVSLYCEEDKPQSQKGHAGMLSLPKLT